jgi:hypothetical protein
MHQLGLKRTAKLAIACMGIVVLSAFFFLAPVVSTVLDPCFAGGYGYSSLSFHLFHIGESYLFGRFSWMTHGPNYNCF